MNDRELLELAAKAAGLPYTSANYADPGELEGGWGMVKSIGDFWNPLENDGDALRLAVKLGVYLSIDLHNRIIFCNEEDYFYDESKFGGRCDPYAATRRAIVRAAAEIGRNMK